MIKVKGQGHEAKRRNFYSYSELSDHTMYTYTPDIYDGLSLGIFICSFKVTQSPAHHIHGFFQCLHGVTKNFVFCCRAEIKMKKVRIGEEHY